MAVIPAAGNGMRFLPSRYAKELFPIGYDMLSTTEGGIRPRLAIQYGLDGLRSAGVRQAYVIISDNKYELIRVLGDGTDYGVLLAFLHQKQARGLPAALDVAYPWLRNCITVMVLPDTIFTPIDAVDVVVSAVRKGDADVVLAVFPTDHPEELCPVAFDEQRNAIQFFDKVKGVQLSNTWGLGAWTPHFGDFLHNFLREESPKRTNEITLAEVFSAALNQGISIRCQFFQCGVFYDIGNNSSLIRAIRAVELPILNL